MAKERLAQYAIAIVFHVERKSVGGSPAADPGIDIAQTPVIGRDRVRPIAVAPVHPSEIGSAKRTVLRKIEPVAAPDIDCRSLRDLHRPLRAAWLRTPHSEIGAVAGFGAVHGEGDTIQIGDRGWTEQFDIGAPGYRTP